MKARIGGLLVAGVGALLLMPTAGVLWGATLALFGFVTGLFFSLFLDEKNREGAAQRGHTVHPWSIPLLSATTLFFFIGTPPWLDIGVYLGAQVAGMLAGYFWGPVLRLMLCPLWGIVIGVIAGSLGPIWALFGLGAVPRIETQGVMTGVLVTLSMLAIVGRPSPPFLLLAPMLAGGLLGLEVARLNDFMPSGAHLLHSLLEYVEGGPRGAIIGLWVGWLTAAFCDEPGCKRSR